MVLFGVVDDRDNNNGDNLLMTNREASEFVINKLKARITEIPTESFPNNPDQYRMSHPIGVLLVHYRRSNYKREEVNHLAVNQERDLNIAIRIKTVSLTGNSGALEFVERVIETIQGLDVTEMNQVRVGRIYILEDYFVDYDSSTGIWDYEVIVGVPSERIQREDLI